MGYGKGGMGLERNLETEWRQSEGRVEAGRSYGEGTAKLRRSQSEGTAVEKNGAKKVNISKKICTFAIII